MGKNALVLGFLPALVAGLLMGYFLNAYPTAAGGKVGGKGEKVVSPSDPFMQAMDTFLLPVLFILMVLISVRFIFNLGALGLISSLLGYGGIVMIMLGVEFFGFLYLFLGGILCIASPD